MPRSWLYAACEVNSGLGLVPIYTRPCHLTVLAMSVRSVRKPDPKASVRREVRELVSEVKALRRFEADRPSF